MLLRALILVGDRLGALVSRAILIPKSMRLSNIVQIHRDLNKATESLSARDARAALKSLTIHPIFPVINSNRRDHDGFDRLVPASETNVYIVDRKPLLARFRGNVPLLAFTSKKFFEMENLLALLGILWQQLSKIVQTETRPQGHTNVHRDYTRFFRAHSTFIQM